MSTASDIKKMTDVLHLPDALDALSNSDRDREAAAARQHPTPEDEPDDESAEGQDAVPDSTKPARP
ncbi:hypothetical protein [Xylophilus sp. ASV27]|uniref:hypothetical protein n=1 Tax=Xylophilus sp. ASV27 TaxID=2795129 RepID=UPI0018ED4892|nr:hypothetical protein [Xylophilus sp. ASV27]